MVTLLVCWYVTSVVSDSVQPHRRKPTRLPRPWDSPGKNTGVGCHFLLQCMKVKSESEVTQLYPTRSDPMNCSLPGSSIHGIFQASVLECGASASPVVTLTTGKNASGNLGSKRLYCLSNGYNASSVRSSAKYRLETKQKHELRGGTLVANFEFSQSLVEHLNLLCFLRLTH